MDIKYALTFALESRKMKNSDFFLGSLWEIMVPYTRFFAYFFAIYIGLRKSADINGTPYFPWLVIGLVPWLLISGLLKSGSRAMKSNAKYISNSPISSNTYVLSTIFEGFINNILLLATVFVVLFAFKIPITLNYLNVIYYYVILFFFMYGLSLITSIWTVWISDIGKFIQSITTLLFWLTPILYSGEHIPAANFNPFYYFINGFRKSLLFNEGLTSVDLSIHIYIWGLTIGLLLIGNYLYKKNRKIIPDII
ncbi:teichoic acid transport system permease protein [Bacilli bacterium PM5-9]|nr:teichoic acid transport system permease protein [Bacilli bacterium PM5-9]